MLRHRINLRSRQSLRRSTTIHVSQNTRNFRWRKHSGNDPIRIPRNSTEIERTNGVHTTKRPLMILPNVRISRNLPYRKTRHQQGVKVKAVIKEKEKVITGIRTTRRNAFTAKDGHFSKDCPLRKRHETERGHKDNYNQNSTSTENSRVTPEETGGTKIDFSQFPTFIKRNTDANNTNRNTDSYYTNQNTDSYSNQNTDSYYTNQNTDSYSTKKNPWNQHVFIFDRVLGAGNTKFKIIS